MSQANTGRALGVSVSTPTFEGITIGGDAIDPNATTVATINIGTQTTDKVGYYGTTPVVQQSTSLGTTVDTTVAVSTTSNIWGFSTSTQANNIVSLLNSLYTAMTTYGLLST